MPLTTVIHGASLMSDVGLDFTPIALPILLLMIAVFGILIIVIINEVKNGIRDLKIFLKKEGKIR